MIFYRWFHYIGFYFKAMQIKKEKDILLAGDISQALFPRESCCHLLITC